MEDEEALRERERDVYKPAQVAMRSECADESTERRSEMKMEIWLKAEGPTYLDSTAARRIENPDVLFYPMMLSLKWL